MDRQYTLCVLVPAHQYRSYVDGAKPASQAYRPQQRVLTDYQPRHDYRQLLLQQQQQLQLHRQQQSQYHRPGPHQQHQKHQNYLYQQQLQLQQYQQQQDLQRQQQQQGHQEQIYENVVSQYQMRMCYQNDYENDEQIQRFYWEQCYRRDDSDATAYYYCEYVRIGVFVNRAGILGLGLCGAEGGAALRFGWMIQWSAPGPECGRREPTPDSSGSGIPFAPVPGSDPPGSERPIIVSLRPADSCAIQDSVWAQSVFGGVAPVTEEQCAGSCFVLGISCRSPIGQFCFVP